MENAQESYYSRTALKDRGWNDKLIKMFLGAPDQSGRRVCRYEAVRVHRAEARPSFAEAQRGSAARRYAARRVADAKKERKRLWLEAVTVKVHRIDEETLTRLAIEQHNAGRLGTNEPLASADSDKTLLDRICIRYLRRSMTGLDRLLEQAAGTAGTGEACVRLKQKVLGAIAEAYPELADECARQAKRVDDSPFWS
jgi:hypothetical protein